MLAAPVRLGAVFFVFCFWKGSHWVIQAGLPSPSSCLSLPSCKDYRCMSAGLDRPRCSSECCFCRVRELSVGAHTGTSGPPPPCRSLGRGRGVMSKPAQASGGTEKRTELLSLQLSIQRTSSHQPAGPRQHVVCNCSLQQNDGLCCLSL